MTSRDGALPGAAARLFEEHFDQLAAMVRRRLETVGRYRAGEGRAALTAALPEWVEEFGRLLRVVYRRRWWAALREEAGWYLALLTARGPGGEAVDLLLDSWVVALHGLIKPPECHLLAEPLQEVRRALRDGRVPGVELAPAPVEVARLVELLVAGEGARAQDFLAAELDRGAAPGELITARLLPALAEIGRLWHRQELAIYQEHLATETVMRLLHCLPALAPRPAAPARRALVSCVPGDEHQVAALALATYLELEGWRVYSLGRSLPAEEIAAAVAALKPAAVFLSLALLSRLEEALATVALLTAREPRPVLVVGGRGARPARELLEAAGARVAADFPEGHRLALGELSHA
ncbi:MAG: cobalamin-dependent protein [Syntrophobacterales bacterium]|nr:cobalamin-dependent protein [Syntrophobacterales bacterium]